MFHFMPFHVLICLRVSAVFLEMFSYCCFFSAISIDYDLYINDESKSSSVSLAAPFDLGTSSLSIAMWIQFNSHESSGVFFTLYSVE